jgi:hypothetical protein
MGAGRTPRACTPARQRDRGSKGQGGRARRGITRPAQADCGRESVRAVRAEGRGDRPGRSRIVRDFTLARARAEPLAPKQKGRLRRSEAKVSRQSRDRLKRHPQEGQHRAAVWRDPGPSASGERHISIFARGIDATGRDAARLGSREPGAALAARSQARKLKLSGRRRSSRSTLSRSPLDWPCESSRSDAQGDSPACRCR